MFASPAGEHRSGEPLHQEQDGDRATEDPDAQWDGDDQQGAGGGDEPGHRGELLGDAPGDTGHLEGVVRGNGENLSGGAGCVATGMEDPADGELAQVVLAVAVDPHHAEHRALVGQGHQQECPGQDAEPGDQGVGVTGHDRPVDEDTDEHGDGRLAEVVHDQSDGAECEAPGSSVTCQRDAQNLPGGDGAGVLRQVGVRWGPHDSSR